MDVAVIEELLSARGRELLGSLPAYREADSLALGAQLRRDGYDPALISAALTQSRLRAAAQAKFADPSAMFFTQAGLQQATREVVAARHAARFGGPVVDLGCGIGTDALAFARRGLPVTAVEIDDVTAKVAAANLAAFPQAHVIHDDATNVTVPKDAWVYLDPARRDARGRRTHDIADYTPPWDFALRSARAAVGAGMKVAPALPDEDVPQDVEAEWVSVDGAVVEAALWFGEAARSGVRRAATLVRGGNATELTSSQAHRQVVEAGQLGDFIAEPDGAIIRAGLLGDVAEPCGGRLVDPQIAYITCDVEPRHVGLQGFAVREVLPLQPKTIAQYLKKLDVGRVTIKKRGVDVLPEQLRAKLKLKGPAEATLILTRIDGKHSALVVDPVVASGPTSVAPTTQ